MQIPASVTTYLHQRAGCVLVWFYYLRKNICTLKQAVRGSSGEDLHLPPVQILHNTFFSPKIAVEGAFEDTVRLWGLTLLRRYKTRVRFLVPLTPTQSWQHKPESAI